MKFILAMGFFILPISSALSQTPSFDPLTGTFKENCDLSCFQAKISKPDTDRLGNIKPSPTKIEAIASKSTHNITIKTELHNHVGTIAELAKIDLVNHKLDSLALKQVKSDLSEVIASIEHPAHLTPMYIKFKADMENSINTMNQEQLMSSMLGVIEIAKSLGQKDLEISSGSILSKVAPEVAHYLKLSEGYVTDRDPMLAILIDSGSVETSFLEQSKKASINSHISGFSAYSYSSSGAGKWSEEDRAHAAVLNAFKRSVQVGGSASAIGFAVGSAVPGVGSASGAIAAGVVGGTAGAIFGAIEGYHHPDLGETAPTGTKTTTEVKVTINTVREKNEETDEVETTVTEVKTTTTTTENLKTGEKKIETTIVETPTVTVECGGKKCEGKEIKEEDKGSCGDPYDIDNRRQALTKEQKLAEQKAVKEQVLLVRDSLILLTEPRYLSIADAGRFKEILKLKRDSLINPVIGNESVSVGLEPETFEIDPVFDPQKESFIMRKLK